MNQKYMFSIDKNLYITSHVIILSRGKIKTPLKRCIVYYCRDCPHQKGKEKCYEYVDE